MIIPGKDIPANMRVIYNGADLTNYSGMLDFIAAEPESLLTPPLPRITSWEQLLEETVDNVLHLTFITLN